MDELIEEVAARFRLGAVSNQVEVSGGFTNRMLCLDTDRGRFAVKLVDASLERHGDRRLLEQAVELELAAIGRGMSAPEPVLDQRGQALVHVQSQLVRVHRWVVGWSPDSGPAEPALAAQVGRWLARLHALELPAVAHGEMVAIASPAPIWDRYVVAATGRPWVAAFEAARPAIGEILAVTAGRGAAGPVIGTHRDLFPRNTLVAADGLVVCDWDVAGAWAADEEIVAAAVEWSGGILGPVRTEPFGAVLDGYRDGGGQVPEPDPVLWSGYLVKQLNWLEAQLRRALLDPGTEAAAAAEHRLPFLFPRLVRQVGEWDRWVGLMGQHLRQRRVDPLR